MHLSSELRTRWGLVAASAALMAISSGVWYAAYHAGGAAGIWLAGYAHDGTGTYRLPFAASMLSVATTVLLVWVAAPRRLRMTRP